MKKCFIIVLLLLLPSILFAHGKNGQGRVDSLLLELPQKAEDTNKARLLADISYTYHLINPDEGLKYGNEGLDLAQKLKWKRGLALSYNSLGANYVYKPNSARSYECFLKCLGIYEGLGDKNGIAGALIDIGNIYYYYSDFPKAREYYTRSGNLYEELGDKRNIARNVSAIGNTYASQGNYAKALEYCLKSLKIDERIGDRSGIIVVTGDIGSIYASDKNYTEAIAYNKKALKLAEKAGDIYYKAVNLCNIAECYLHLIDDTSLKTKEYRAIPKATMLRNAITYLNEALAISTRLHVLDIVDHCYVNLVWANRITGNYKKALEYTGRHDAVKDTLYSKENNDKVLKLSIQNEYDRVRLADSLKVAERDAISVLKLQKQRSFTYIGMAGIIALLGFSFFIVKERGKSERERKKSEVLAKNLQDLLQQKDVLMKEIHHRVKNNLTVISALLELQLENVSDIHAIGAMKESTSRVRSISLIHQQLYQDEHITAIELSKLTRDLFQQISIVFKKHGNNITLDNRLAETMQDIDTAVPLGLILNELMTNSYKYAFTGVDNGTITISIERHGDLHHLLYNDSGPGLPEGFDMTKVKSLGMRVIRNLSKQLAGKFYYDFDTKVFHVTFKDLEERKKIA